MNSRVIKSFVSSLALIMETSYSRKGAIVGRPVRDAVLVRGVNSRSHPDSLVIETAATEEIGEDVIAYSSLLSSIPISFG